MMGRLFGLLIGCVLCGCSLDYEEAVVQEDMAESIPDIVLESFRHSLVRDGRIVAVLEAERAELFDKRSETYLHGVRFWEYDRQGELVTEVQADEALWHTDTEDAEATGEIHAYSSKEKAEVFAPSLTWKKADRTLAARPEEQVLLRKEDGSELSGSGFSADFRNSTLRLSAARGIYVSEDGGSTLDGTENSGSEPR